MPFDTIVGVSRNDLKTLQGSKTSDLLIIEESSLYIKTLEGDDTISGTSGVKDLIIYSGKDNDQVIFNAEILDSSFGLGAGNDKVEIMDFSHHRGGVGEDSIISSDIRKIAHSLIRGDAGNDILIWPISPIRSLMLTPEKKISYGSSANSELYGGRDNDTLTANTHSTR